jgi:glycosyltransferase involved in cell wall biosynthesis
MNDIRKKTVLSIIIPCFNEEHTLEKVILRVLEIQDQHLTLEIIVVDDHSTDRSASIAEALQNSHTEIKLVKHSKNQGKGAALHTGIAYATGDFVAIQDADLEYDPFDLKKLLIPLLHNKADVVIGSRFLTSSTRRILNFWHSIGNSILTIISNMLTDLNLSDMESCYKVFRRETIQSLDLKEKRFGFEPEVVAKIAHRKLRIFEMGISYYGRSYSEGKKISAKDGWRALYCILKYNLHQAPWPMQLFFYLFIGGTAALLNLGIFLFIQQFVFPLSVKTGIAFVTAAAFNYLLCIWIMFKHKARWNSVSEILIFLIVVSMVGVVDYYTTHLFISHQFSPALAKIFASAMGLMLNFAGRKWLVFPTIGGKTNVGLKK